MCHVSQRSNQQLKKVVSKVPKVTLKTKSGEERGTGRDAGAVIPDYVPSIDAVVLKQKSLIPFFPGESAL